MLRFLVMMISLSFGIQAFAAPEMAAKSKSTSNKSSAKKSQSGKSTASISTIKPLARPYRIVPMIGMASFRLGGTQDLRDSRTDDGLSVSVLGDYDYGPITLQGGMSYYQMGARGTVINQNNVPIAMKVNLEYLALTAGAKYYFKNRQLYGKASLSPAFKMRSEVKSTSPVRRTQELHNVRDMDVIFALGGGAEVPFYQNVRVGGELTYNRGLIDASTHGNGQVFNEGFLFSAFLSL